MTVRPSSGLIAVLLVVGLAAGCGSDEEPSTAPPKEPSSAPTTTPPRVGDAAVYLGTVVQYNGDRKFGYIKERDSARSSIFFDRTGLRDPNVALRVNELVSFELREGKKGTQAYDVAMVR